MFRPNINNRKVWHICQLADKSVKFNLLLKHKQFTQQTVNNRKLPHMLLQSLDIFEISGMVDNHHISIVPSAHTFG